MKIVTPFIIILSIFTSQVILSTSETKTVGGAFNKISGDVLRLISEYAENPFIMRSINKAFLEAIPSAQARIAKYFGSEFLNVLPSTPELWHLLEFNGRLQDLILRDPARYLPRSFSIITETITRNIVDKSLTLLKDDTKLFLKILRDQSSATLSNLYPIEMPASPIELHKNEKLIFVITKSLSVSRSVEQQIKSIEKIEPTSEDLFIALLESIKRISYQEGIFERLKLLISALSEKLNSADHVYILNVLAILKFDSFSMDIFDYSAIFAEFDDNSVWRDYFALVAIQVFRIDVLRMALFPLKCSVSHEIQIALLKTPEILSKFNKETAELIFDSKGFLNYRIMFDKIDFDLRKQTITKDDVIVSGYKHEPERFRQVVSRFQWNDFRDVSDVLSCFFRDLRLFQHLIVISNIFESLQSVPELVLPEIKFSVLKQVILKRESFQGLLGNNFEYFRIAVPPKVMADVLRDNQLYRILKENTGLFLNRFYFSFIDAIPLFTEYDWKRLFALSPVPYNFNPNHSSLTLRTINSPLSCTPISDALDFTKSNMADFIMLETSIQRLRSSLDQFLLFAPLLSIWARNDIIGYLEFFHSVNHKLIEN